MYVWFFVLFNLLIVLIRSMVCDCWVIKKKRRIVIWNYDVVVFGDYGNNVLLLFILELDFIGGVVCGLVEGWLVLVCLKFGYVKCYEIYK